MKDILKIVQVLNVRNVKNEGNLGNSVLRCYTSFAVALEFCKLLYFTAIYGRLRLYDTWVAELYQCIFESLVRDVIYLRNKTYSRYWILLNFYNECLYSMEIITAVQSKKLYFPVLLLLPWRMLRFMFLVFEQTIGLLARKAGLLKINKDEIVLLRLGLILVNINRTQCKYA